MSGSGLFMDIAGVGEGVLQKREALDLRLPGAGISGWGGSLE